MQSHTSRNEGRRAADLGVQDAAVEWLPTSKLLTALFCHDLDGENELPLTMFMIA